MLWSLRRATAHCGLAATAGVLWRVSAARADQAPHDDASEHDPATRRPKVPYPHWDLDWDGRHGEAGSKKRGPTRHILLVRHGQYVEELKEDETRVLTPLGQKQAEATGRRLAALLAATADSPVRLHTSTLTRAKETAAIIRSQLPDGVEVLPENAALAEGWPARVIPARSQQSDKMIDRDSARIEGAFKSLFHRGRYESDQGDGEDARCASRPKHEWDIVVCHANVIRYMALRALQLPPEAWLRLSTFNASITYIVIRPSGSVSLRTLGDVGHLSMEETTFSGHHGFEW